MDLFILSYNIMCLLSRFPEDFRGFIKTMIMIENCAFVCYNGYKESFGAF